MPRNRDSIFELLIALPWWVSVSASAVAYLALAIVVPSLSIENPFLKGFVLAAPQLAPILGLVLLVPAPLSALQAWRKRKLLDSQRDLTSIRELSWREFEELVAEAYRRQGYQVAENPRAGADGGVDIRLEKSGALHLIQCKQWRSSQVGVRVVRELYGVMSAEHAASGSVISSGVFTQEAKRFAVGKSIDLVDGTQLAEMVKGVQAANDKTTHVETQAESPRAESCPQCGSALVHRVARKGKNAGQAFMGCSTFPQCRYSRGL